MHLVIINGSPRTKSKSNTTKIITSFQKGFEESGNTSDVWYLSDRNQWESAAEAFEKNDHILFALPLFVENISGTMLEFLEALPPKKMPGTSIAFVLQGGFPERSQLRCGERFLEMLPAQLGCEYAGTLIKGDMFGAGLMGEKLGAQLVAPFEDAGRRFAVNGVFEKQKVNTFAGPEYMPEKEVRKFNRFGCHMQKFFMGRIAKKLGCKDKLDAQPYGELVK
jgi:hypothetical protein